MKNQKGITLIALVITIIVMLILVGVSVTVALNGGLFTTAQDAASRTEAERDKELAISNGDIISQYVSGNESETDIEYAIGTEVTIGETEENFYVIKDEGAKLVLLAEKNIKLDNQTQKYKQADGNNGINFSDDIDPYWPSEEEYTEYNNAHDEESYNAYLEKWSKTYPRNLNNEEYDSVRGNDAVAKARQYAQNTIENGAIGRLMTEEEAKFLDTTEEYKKLLYGTKTTTDGLYYWLGYADGTDSIGIADPTFGITGNYYGNCQGCIGIRPVIEISEALVTIVP